MRNHMEEDSNKEDSNMEMCAACAEYNGHTLTEAENCSDGSVGCPECPFMFRPGIVLIKAAKLKEVLRVVKTYPADGNGFKEIIQPIKVVFEGTTGGCYDFMREQPDLNILELIYSNGRLASYVL